MSLLDAVERLLAVTTLSQTAEVHAESLRSIAERIDAGGASDAVSAQLHHELAITLERITERGGFGSDSAPRVGLLRGDQARSVLLGLGYPDPDGVDLMFGFDWLEALRLKRERRLLGLPEQPGLDALLAAAIDRHEVRPDELESEPRVTPKTKKTTTAATPARRPQVDAEGTD